MAKLVIFLSILIVGCTSSSPVLYVMTGHQNQKQVIDATFQHALEHNPDGVVSAWNDDTADKSGYIKPMYASYDWKPPCRHFEIAYFGPGTKVKKYYGQACRRNGVWRIH
jgi:surface antigen